MGARTWIEARPWNAWPVFRQLTTMDPLGRGAAAKSRASSGLKPRTRTSDKVVKSVCPYCAVGCALVAYTKKSASGEVQLLQIEGDPDSPVNEGRLCPKGASSLQLAVSTRRVNTPLYREPGATEWKQVSWDFALDKLAGNIKASRDRTFVTVDGNGNTVNRCEGIAFAGGAAFSSEEGYFATKVMRSLGMVYLEQQARV